MKPEKIGSLTASDGTRKHLFEVYRVTEGYAVQLDGDPIKSGLTHTNAVANIIGECKRRGWRQVL